MNIPQYARYEYCYKRAFDFLEKYDITTYPVNPLTIIQQEHYGLMKYSDVMKIYECSLSKVKQCFRSNDGYTTLELIGNKAIYSIAYNDKSESIERIRFTLMHELGHIFLNHLMDYEITDIQNAQISAEEYNTLEKEANAFARNVLAPASVVMKMKNKHPRHISTIFGISVQAAETRMDLLDLDITSLYHFI